MEPLKVLVVDDDPDLLASVCQLLAFFGHRLIAAGGVAEAATALSEYAPDVIISDWDLGGDRPTALLQLAQERLPGVSIVLMTGGHGVEVAATVARGLAHVALTKPFALVVLFEAIERARALSTGRHSEEA